MDWFFEPLEPVFAEQIVRWFPLVLSKPFSCCKKAWLPCRIESLHVALVCFSFASKLAPLILIWKETIRSDDFVYGNCPIPFTSANLYPFDPGDPWAPEGIFSVSWYWWAKFECGESFESETETRCSLWLLGTWNEFTVKGYRSCLNQRDPYRW